VTGLVSRASVVAIKNIAGGKAATGPVDRDTLLRDRAILPSLGTLAFIAPTAIIGRPAKSAGGTVGAHAGPGIWGGVIGDGTGRQAAVAASTVEALGFPLAKRVLV